MIDDGVVEDQVVVHIAEALVVKPGDTLIVRLNPAGLTPAKVFDIQARLHTMFPDVRGVVFAADGQMAVQRAPELDDPARPLVPLPERVRDDRVRDREQERADHHDGHGVDVPADNCPRCGTAFNLAPLPESKPFAVTRTGPPVPRVERGTDGPGGTT